MSDQHKRRSPCCEDEARRYLEAAPVAPGLDVTVPLRTVTSESGGTEHYEYGRAAGVLPPDVLAKVRAIPALRLTGEQLGSIDPPPESAANFSIDFDEYEDFVPLSAIEAASGTPDSAPNECRVCGNPREGGVHDAAELCDEVRGPCLDPRRHHPFTAAPPPATPGLRSLDAAWAAAEAALNDYEAAIHAALSGTPGEKP